MQSKIDIIVERLKKIKPYKIILFGSKAYGKPRTDSDIDLIVVTNDDYLPKTYKEKSDVYLKVSNALNNDFQKTIFKPMSKVPCYANRTLYRSI